MSALEGFKVAVHHGGVFNDDCSFYFGGTVSIFKYMDINCWSGDLLGLLLMDFLAINSDWVSLCYVCNSVAFKPGLFRVRGHDDYMKIGILGYLYQIVNVYVIHPLVVVDAPSENDGNEVGVVLRLDDDDDDADSLDLDVLRELVLNCGSDIRDEDNANEWLFRQSEDGLYLELYDKSIFCVPHKKFSSLAEFVVPKSK